MLFLIALLSVAGFAWYVMSPDERRRLLDAARGQVGILGRGVLANLDACRPYLDALRTRMPHPVVASAVATTYVLVFAGTGASAGSDTLVRWGATFGPRTANGEWWRLITALFLHQGLLSLVLHVLVVVQLGMIVERLFGHATFAIVFAAGGVLANSIHLAAHPTAVRTGASGGLYALYGLLIAWTVQGLREPSDLAIPRPALRLLAPVACVFVLTSIVSDTGAFAANIAALTVGVVAGFLVASNVLDASPAPGRVAAVAGSALAVVAFMAVPSIGTVDVRPEIARVVALEAQTAAPYGKAVEQFRRGTTSAEALGKMIDSGILPAFREAEARLDALHGVPPEHRSLVADAERYVRLRRESWDLRARALHASNMRMLRAADNKERESLDALEQLQATRSGR